MNAAETTTDHVVPAAFCPQFHHAVELIGRRWSGAVVRAMLYGGITRFSDLIQAVPGLSDRMLSERLKELESEGVVTRTVIPDTPVRIEYHLTEKGRALAGVVDAVAAWAGEWVPAEDAAGDDDQAPARGSAVEPTGRRG
jgi:DNA-binding HxlR family transcriptional regulator